MTWFGNYYYKLITISLICCKVLLSGLILAITFLDARDTITGGIDSIKDINNETLISAGNRFQLGFFALNGNSGYSRYVGIWYYKLNPQAIVWVANRNSPLYESTGVFTIADNGNLVVMDGTGNSSYFSSGPESSPPISSKERKVQLLASGNLVLSDHDGKILWQSFDHPTDTFLPGMKMNQILKLVSWKTPTVDPFPGNFSFAMEGENIFVIRKTRTGEYYWKSRESAGPGSSFDSSYEIPNVVLSLLNFGQTTTKGNKYSSPLVDSNSRLRMSPYGKLEYLRWDKIVWSAPGDVCSVDNVCGPSGSCSISDNGELALCKCLPGFKPRSVKDWNSGQFSSGCERNTATCSTNYTFLELKMVKVGNPDMILDDGVAEEDDCKSKCLEICTCLAHSFKAADLRRGTNASSPGCWIWNSDLKNLREHVERGHNLSIRVAVADIESTAINCKPCGENIIPYPLGTSRSCGDPGYQHFLCNSSTGQIYFQGTNDSYKVTSINPNNLTFDIQLASKNRSRRHGDGNNSLIDINPPFLYSSTKIDQDMKVITIQIAWVPPDEPYCISPQDCKDWPNSSCDGRRKRCLCNANYKWDNFKINCTTTLLGQGIGNSPRPSEGSGPSGQTKKSFSWTTVIISTVLVVLVVLLCIGGCILYRRRKSKQKQENRENIQQNQVLGLFDTERRVKNFIDSGDFNDEDKKGIDVPFFDLESILAATNNFSDANKLGQGGFGPVYKGLFPGGQEIAVKRLSSHSGQGLEEFKNEVVLIAKLQHRNLVRLLGYCIRGDEKILLYEYMPNKSLDSFIFDQTLCMALDWDKRFDIILGIARGLLYLHQDSRLRIIHRDLKTSNILLDGEMNPKISDFGLARIVGGKETEANTNRVVGTYGYMSPEYALHGLFSIKSDVFSFGVIVLEIVSGMRNTGFYKSQQALHLLGHAWSLWKQEKALDLIDQTLLESCNKSEVLKCIIVGLLCVQEEPGDRPAMPNVVFMLGSETETLPHPKQPAFIAKKWLSNTPSSSSKPETSSINEWTISEEEPR